MKIVINRCYGGFGLSHKAIMLYAKLKGIKLYAWIDDIVKDVYKEKAIIGNNLIGGTHYCTIPIKDEADYQQKIKEKKNKDFYWSAYTLKRDDPILVQVVEMLGKKANSRYSDLKVVKIPNNVEWEIDEYDGNEHIAEKHRTWR